MSRKILQVRVTSTTHPEGDLQEYNNAEDAMLYAAELVEGGFEPDVQVHRAGVWEPISYEDLIELAAE